MNNFSGSVTKLMIPVDHGRRSIQCTVIGKDDARPMVAIHGLGGSSAETLPKLRHYAEAYGLRIYALDLPGHGKSSPVGRSVFGIKTFCDLLIEAIEELGLTKIYGWGHSMGGLVITIIAARRPDLVSQLWLWNPAIGGLWDIKARQCRRNPLRLLILTEQLGYNAENINRGQLHHFWRVLRSLYRIFTNGQPPTPYRHLQASIAVLYARHTERFLHVLAALGTAVHWMHAEQDVAIPGHHSATLFSGFHGLPGIEEIQDIAGSLGAFIWPQAGESPA